MTTQANPTRISHSVKTHPAMVSKWLDKTQLRGVNRCGDVVIPGDGKDFPAFSETGLINTTSVTPEGLFAAIPIPSIFSMSIEA